MWNVKYKVWYDIMTNCISSGQTVPTLQEFNSTENACGQGQLIFWAGINYIPMRVEIFYYLLGWNKILLAVAKKKIREKIENIWSNCFISFSNLS